MKKILKTFFKGRFATSSVNSRFPKKCARFENIISNSKKLLIIGKKSEFQSIKEKLMHANVNDDLLIFLSDTKNNLSSISLKDKKLIDQVIVCTPSPVRLGQIVQLLVNDRWLKNAKLHYFLDLESWHRLYKNKLYTYGPLKVVDSQIDMSIFNKVYEDSLKKFERKCQVDDAYELYQCLFKTQDVDGEIIELGSYKGHSGWLIEALSTKLRSKKKKVLLCDTFENFPYETLGIDKHWSETHSVMFEEVKKKFSNKSRVKFVKGDIRDTLPKLKENKFSFVYVDVDSYDATLYGITTLFPRINKGGVLLCQDYGKPHLAGARLACDEYFSKRKDVFSYFSFFSGCKIYVKV